MPDAAMLAAVPITTARNESRQDRAMPYFSNDALRPTPAATLPAPAGYLRQAWFPAATR